MKNFKNSNRLRVHMRNIHQKTESFSCTQCPKRFNNKKSTPLHIASYHIEKTSVLDQLLCCKICEKSCSTKTNLTTHMALVHTEESEKRQQCPSCFKLYLRLGDLNEHMKIHKKESKTKGIKCEFCWQSAKIAVTAPIERIT